MRDNEPHCYADLALCRRRVSYSLIRQLNLYRGRLQFPYPRTKGAATKALCAQRCERRLQAGELRLAPGPAASKLLNRETAHVFAPRAYRICVLLPRAHELLAAHVSSRFVASP